MKYIKPVLLVLTVIIICFCSCQKELSCEGPECRGIYDDGKAIYSFPQRNGECLNPIVKGSYFEEVPLSDSNYILLKVHVMKKGAYTISTDTVLGFYFNSEGTFADTGIVTIDLKGMGKPDSSGTYTFTSSRTSGCKFTVNVDTVPYVERFFYDITIDGVRHQETVMGGTKIWNYQHTVQDFYLTSLISNGSYVTNLDGSSWPVGFVIGKGIMQLPSVTVAGFQTFFSAGFYNYNPPGYGNGILIGWQDMNEPAYLWESYKFPYTQTSSSFTIDSVNIYTDTQGRPIAKVKASFNCILYNGKGDSKVLTNGKFYGEFANIDR